RRWPTCYNAAKVAQERGVADACVPGTVVAATQFHELVAATLGAAARRGVVPLLRAPVQPVAAAEAGAAVAAAALRDPLGGTTTVAGPEVLDLRDAARTWRAATGSRGVPVRVPLPGALGRALRAGGLTDPRPDVRGTTTFRVWLAAQRAERAAAR
ncbi:NAD-dependent dehydratase, partial [Sphaerisporangium cinnabarinum]